MSEATVTRVQNQGSLSGSERESWVQKINSRMSTLHSYLILPPQNSDQLPMPWPLPWTWSWSYPWSTWLSSSRPTNLSHNASNTRKEAGDEVPPFCSQCQACQEIFSTSTSTSTSTYPRNNPNHHQRAPEPNAFRTQCGDYRSNITVIPGSFKYSNPVPQENVAAAASPYPYPSSTSTHTGKDHMRIPAFKINLFKCQLCRHEVFMQISCLRRHWETHIVGEKAPYMCPLCDRWFMSKSYALRHLRLHMGDSPHKCDNCGRQFLSHANLKSHINTHVNDFQFICSTCGAPYKRACHFTRHIKNCRGNKNRLANNPKKIQHQR